MLLHPTCSESEMKGERRINSGRRRHRALLSDKQCFVWDGFLLEVRRLSKNSNTSQQSTDSCNKGLNVLQKDYRVKI